MSIPPAETFVSRYPMGQRSWTASLVVELIDPVTGLLVHRGVDVSLATRRAAALRPAVTLSGRFTFRNAQALDGAALVVSPCDAPFFPVSVDVPQATAGARDGPRPLRVVLVPRRDYPFAPSDAVIHHVLKDDGGPVAGAEVALDPADGISAAPARTDEAGEFVLYVRWNGRGARNGAARAAEPMPPGLEPPAKAAPAEGRRVGLVFARGEERRRLPAGAAPVLPERGRTVPTGPDDVIRWDRLEPLGEPPPAPEPAPGRARSRRGRSG